MNMRNKIMKTVIAAATVICTLSLSANNTYAAAPSGLDWYKEISDNGAINRLYSVCQLKDGSYIAVGSTSTSSASNASKKSLKIRFDNTGTYKIDSSDSVNRDCYLSVVATSDGGYATSYYYGAVAKYGVDNTKQWQVYPFEDPSLTYLTVISSIINQTQDGGFLVCAKYSGRDAITNKFTSYASVVKLDSLGNMQWRYKLDGMYNIINSAVQNPDGTYMACGACSNSPQAGFLIKLDSNGKFVDKIFPRLYAYSFLKGIKRTENGYILVGHDNNNSSRYLIKYDSNLKEIFSVDTEMDINEFCANEDGSYVVTGQLKGSSSNLLPVAKYDASGKLLWKSSFKPYSDSNTNYISGNNIIPISGNKYIIVGSSGLLSSYLIYPEKSFFAITKADMDDTNAQH